MRLVAKDRVGSKTLKRHDSPKTPYKKNMESPGLTQIVGTHNAAHSTSYFAHRFEQRQRPADPQCLIGNSSGLDFNQLVIRVLFAARCK
jgi:hypothetical protein